MPDEAPLLPVVLLDYLGVVARVALKLCYALLELGVLGDDGIVPVNVPVDILERADKAVHRAPERLEYRLAYNPPEIGVPARDRHRNCGDKGDNYRDGGHYYSLFRDKVLQWSALRN